MAMPEKQPQIVRRVDLRRATRELRVKIRVETAIVALLTNEIRIEKRHGSRRRRRHGIVPMLRDDRVVLGGEPESLKVRHDRGVAATSIVTVTAGRFPTCPNRRATGFKRMPDAVRIALLALKHPETTAHGLDMANTAMKTAAARGARIACFPETYFPGLRGIDVDLPKPDRAAMEHVLQSIRSMARTHRLATIVGMEWPTHNGLLNLAYVVSPAGRVLGHQAKNQITPGGESRHYVPDGRRRVFTLCGVRCGIVICHEGWRYPETVRWAACRGAKIVFQPQVTGSDRTGRRPKKWGQSFYEMAMVCRAQENAIWFASVNTAMKFQNSATSLIAPDGRRMTHVPYGREQVLVNTIDLSQATRRYAKRYDPRWYPTS